MSICVSHTKSAAVLRKRGIGYMHDAVEYMKPVFHILFLRCGRGKDISICFLSSVNK